MKENLCSRTPLCWGAKPLDGRLQKLQSGLHHACVAWNLYVQYDVHIIHVYCSIPVRYTYNEHLKLSAWNASPDYLGLPSQILTSIYIYIYIH